METTNQNTHTIHTLEEIVMRKNIVLESIHEDDKKIKELWGSLFHSNDPSSKTPAKRITGFLNIGAGVLDGAILAWKLYRKFKKK